MDSAQRVLLERYAEMLANAPLNLVAKGDRDDVWGRHVAEAIRVVEALQAREGERWLDLGTGGGLPGVVLAALRPDVTVTMLDARAKKVRAVQGFVTDLRIANAVAIAGRAEALARQPEHRERYDGVVSRAVGRLDVVAELSRGFLRPGGRLAVVRGADADAELTSVSDVLERIGFEAFARLGIAGAPRVTNVVTMQATGSAPGWLPRADGIPQSAPIGGAPSGTTRATRGS